MPPSSLRIPSALVLALSATTAAAQWPTDPLANLAVAAAAGDQTVAKIAATSDGGCYVGWFDNRSSGYAVYLQRLDPGGNRVWPTELLVSAHPQNSSLVDWDLIADRDDHAVLAFTDVRNGPDLDVHAYRVQPDGVQAWGSNGIALASNTDAEANPRLAETGDGEFVCVWPNTTARTIQVQRIDRSGNLRYGANGLAIPGDGSDTPAFARVVAGNAGSFIVSWVRALAFTGTKHIHTQKFDAAGNPLWGAQRFVLFDAGNVPIAHEPRLLPDGLGGAVYAWHYAVGSVFSARVQRMRSDGSEAFPHNGVDVATHAMSKFDPSPVWHAASQEISVFWNERNTGQSQWGISGQRFDVSGNRSWGASGAVLLAVDGVEELAPVAVPLGDGAQVCVLQTSLGPVQHKVLAMRVAASGGVVGSVVEASRAASEKLRLQAAASGPVTLLCWTDRRSDSGDVYAQNVNADGSLGARLATTVTHGCVSTWPMAVNRPRLGTSYRLGLANPVGQQAGSPTAVLFAALPDPAFPCGTVLPGFGMARGTPGEVLLDLGGPWFALPGEVYAGGGQLAYTTLPIPLDLHLFGAVLHAQGTIVDVAQGHVSLTAAERATLGF